MTTQKIYLSKVTEELLQKAAQETNLDHACALLQDAMGVKDGGFAAVFFSYLEDDEEWGTTPVDNRLEMLRTYVRREAQWTAEANHAAEV